MLPINPKPGVSRGVQNCVMKRFVIFVGSLLLVLAIVIMLRSSRRQSTVRVTGPLTESEVKEITQLVLRERAPLLSGEFAPQDNARAQRHLRERIAGQIRSIASVDGQYVVVDFGDRWNTNIGYDYELRRTTNGWRVVGMGYRGPPKKTGE